MAGSRAFGAAAASLTVSGHLVKIRRGVYATSNVMARAETDPGLRHALYVVAVTDTRTGKGVASHHSAAQLLGLNLLNPQSPGTVMLTVPPGTRVSYYARTGVVCHMAELPSEHLTTLYGVPATTAARTVVDIARTASFMEGVVVTDSALLSGIRRRRSYAGCFCDVIGGPGFRDRGGWLSSRPAWPNRCSSRVRGSFSVSRGWHGPGASGAHLWPRSHRDRTG